MPTGNPSVHEDIHKAKEIRYKMSEQAKMNAGDEANAGNMFLEESTLGASTKASSDPNVGLPNTDHELDFDNTDRESTFPVTAVLYNKPNDFFIAGRNSSMRNPHSLVHQRLKAQKGSDRDDNISLLKAQIVQDGIHREVKHRRRGEDQKEGERERREEHVRDETRKLGDNTQRCR